MVAPTISVVIPTRNRAAYLLEALRSVFEQTYRDFEIIVVDDGSTDGTQQALESLVNQKTIRYLLRDPKGVSAARNFGIEQAQGKYIAFLDSDDLFLPTKLAKQIQVLQMKPGLGFVHCWFRKFNDDGADLGIRDTSRFQGAVYPQMLLEWSVLMAMPCMLMSKKAIEEAGGFDEKMTWAEDLDLWRRIARHYEIDLVPEALVKVRVHQSSTTSDKTNSGDGFVRYLDKALEEDAGLDTRFRQEAKARMYTKLAQNLLGQGGRLQMRIARQHAAKAISQRPLRAAGWLAWIGTLIPSGIRRQLTKRLRSRWYQPS
jgi:glycosyltransferase involved in cell wall biosynthesis